MTWSHNPDNPALAMTMRLKHRILLVEDDEAVRSVLRRGLERAGYEVREAGEGGAALKLLASGPADLVVTDLVMPKMEGIEFILTLRKTQPRLPAIAISGGGRVDGNRYLEIASHLGATRVLAKPFAIEQLIALVQELIGSPPADTPSGKPIPGG